MAPELVNIFDTSLRDGLRNTGITLTIEQRCQFAQQLERLGVDVIEAGYGGPSQIDVMRQIAAAVTSPVVVGLTRVNLKDVRRVLQGVEAANKPGINIFIPTSDRFLEHAHQSREQALEAMVKAVAYAKQYLDHIEASAQDASRADRTYLVNVFDAVIESGATVLCLTDTVGHAVPREFGALCADMRQRVAHGDAVRWSVHCHNPLGLAVANTLEAVEHGVRQVECTVNGIGEGGNTPMQALVNTLHVRQDVFPAVRTGVAFEHLDETGRLLAEMIEKA